MADNVLLHNFAAKQQTVRQKKINKDNPDQKIVVSVSQRSMQMTVGSNGSDNCGREVEDFMGKLRALDLQDKDRKEK